MNLELCKKITLVIWAMLLFATPPIVSAATLGVCGSAAYQRAVVPDKMCVSLGGDIHPYQCPSADKLQCLSQKKSNNPNGYCSTLVSFVSACQIHDSCYGTRGAMKATCDAAFYNNLKGACRSALSGNFPERGRLACYNAAGTYNDAVRQSRGCEAFIAAQKSRGVKNPQCN